jgi:hypothetical protein
LAGILVANAAYALVRHPNERLTGVIFAIDMAALRPPTCRSELPALAASRHSSDGVDPRCHAIPLSPTLIDSY